MKTGCLKLVVYKIYFYDKILIGDYKNTSDIDLAIFSKEISSRNLNLLRDDLYMLDIIYKIDVVDFNRLNKDALKNNILSEGIVIYTK